MDSLRKNLLNSSLEELQIRAKAVVELKDRDSREAAKYYTPNGQAEQFINLVGQDKFFVNMFVGANGTSKTATGSNIVANIVAGVQSDWFKHPLFQEWPYIKKGRIISDPTTIKEKIIPELEKWLPRNAYEKFPEAEYKTEKSGKYYASKFIFKNGWEIDIMSNEQDLKSFESVDLGFVWIDEPMPKDRFLATIARGRMGMIIFWTYTPLFQSAWIKDWMDEAVEKGEADFIEAEMEDNCQLHGVRGFFQHKHIQRIADALPEDEKEARVFGRFGHLIGRVHKLFKRSIHVIKPFKIDEKEWTSYKAIDPHPRVPDHVMYMSVNKKGTKIITAELISEGLVKRLFERMKALETKHGLRIEARIIDPSAYNDDQHRKEKSVGSQLFDLGENYIRGSKDLHAGIKRTDTALAYQMNAGKMIREPELYIFDTCTITIKQIEQYVWQEWKGATGDGKKKNPSPRDKDDHMPENLHRLLLHEPKHIPYQFRTSNVIAKSSGMSKVAEDGFDPYDQ